MKRKLNISFNVSGRGSVTPRLALPITWTKEMGIDQENREVIAEFDGEKIIIRRFGMRENCYLTLMAALRVSEKRIEEGTLLSDGASDWDIYNLMDAIEDDEPKDGDNNYYVVGVDGSIGETKDDGFNVQWIYKPVSDND